LVVVGSKGALHSEAMEDEIGVFLPNKRTIVPVDADGNIRKADWWLHLLDGLTPVEDLAAVPEVPREPAPDVVDHILSAVDFVTRDQRLKKAARWSQRVLAGALTMFLVAAAGTWWWVRHANTKVTEAQSAQTKALLEKKAADRAKETALIAKGTAERLANEAERRREGAENDATLAEERAAEANQLEARTRVIARARSSLTARDPDRAFQLARAALEKGDGDDARLLLAEAWNAGIQAGQADLGGRVAIFEVNPTREDEFADITAPDAGETGRRLEIHRRGSAVVASSEYRYLNFKFDPTGDSIYAIGSRMEKPRTPDDRIVSYSSWLIHYDLNLKPLAEPLKLGPFPIHNVPDACPLRSADSIRIDSTRLLFAGSCGPDDVSPVFGWVDLHEWRLDFNVDPQGSWERYRGQIVPIGPNILVVDSPGGFFLLDLQSSGRQLISEERASDRLLAASPDGNLFVAASTRLPEVSVFRHGSAGKWREKKYELDDPDPVSYVAFVSATRIALLRTLGSVWLLDTDPYYDDHRLGVSFEGDKVALREPAARRLGAHDGPATALAVSPDSNWIATAGDDNTVRLWSVSGADERLFRTGLASVDHLRWSKDGKSLYAADKSGVVHIYRPDASGGLTLRANPLSDRPEFRLPIWSRIVAALPPLPPILEEYYGYIKKLDSNAFGSLAVDTYDNVHTEMG
jgi:WD40 repeat protein